MKKSLALLVVLLMALTMGACGQNGARKSSGMPDGNTPTAQETAPQATGNGFSDRSKEVVDEVSDKDTVPEDVMVGTWVKYIEKDEDYSTDSADWSSKTTGSLAFNADGSFTGELYYIDNPDAKLTFSGSYGWESVDHWNDNGGKAYMLNVVAMIDAQNAADGAPVLPDTATDEDGLWFGFTWMKEEGEQMLCWLHNKPTAFFRKTTDVAVGGNTERDTPRTTPVPATQTSEKPEPQSTPGLSAVYSPQTGGSLGAGELSTTETPTAEDFAWFTDKAEGWVYGITPLDAYTPEDFHAFIGSWKGLQVIFDYDNTVLGYGYFTATFDEDGPDVAATLDWHYIDWTDGNHEELTDREDESMTGSFAAPTLALGEAGNNIELILYTLEGKQYAEGKWTMQSGEEVHMALVRP